jgi:hypothetical protein
MVRLSANRGVFLPKKLLLLALIIILASNSWYANYSDSPSKIEPARAVSKTEYPCNCTLDFVDNAIGFEIPNVKVIKSELMQSQTEGMLEWNESKQLAMDAVLVDDVYIANQSAGALTDLNTIRTANNELFTIEISGGSIPDIVKAEIVNLTDASLNNTSLSLGDIVLDEKLSDKIIQFTASALPFSVPDNSFYIKVPKPGEYMLMLSLGYQDNDGVSDANRIGANMVDLTALYKALLSVHEQN